VKHLLEGGDAQLLASVQYALKRGIEALFQIEDRELAAEPLPSALDRRRILFYEASEGGAGVLARLVDDPTALARVAREALAICHFDPDMGEDRHRAVGAAEDCQAACYNCLLGYTNQREHDLLDRHRVRDLLLRLAGAQTAAGSAAGSGLRDRAAALHALEARCGSELERRFLRFLDEGGYRLPDHASAVVQGYGTRPDFYYEEAQACVYVDGPVHDYPERRARDAAVTDRLEDGGYAVIRVAWPETWQQAVQQHAWVFGAGRGAAGEARP